MRRSAGLLALALGAALLLGGCGNGGFRPLYASAGIGGADATERLRHVDISFIPGRVGQRIRNELIFQTTGGGDRTQPTHRLEIAIRESVTSTLVRIDGDADSQIYGLEASFRLVRLSDNSVALSGDAYSRASFERFESIFSNVRAREDAENRAAKVLADDMKSRVSAFLAGNA